MTWESADALQQGGGFAAAAPAPAGGPSRCGLTAPSLPALFSGPRTVLHGVALVLVLTLL